MKLVIDIPEEMVMALKQGSFDTKYNMYDLVGGIMNGTPLPKGHGDLIDRKALMSVPDRKALMCVPYEKGGFVDWYDEIKYADTIIEADKEK